MANSLNALQQTEVQVPANTAASDANITLPRARRDAGRLKKIARWVVVVDENGNILDLINNEPYLANVFAVLGPANVCGEDIREAVLLEIGISRGCPYARTESSRTGKNRVARRRQKVADLSMNQLRTIWPTLLSVLEECVTSARERWTIKGAWSARTNAGMKEFERGISFSVSSSDQLLREVFLLRDMAHRKYLHKTARIIAHFLRRYKYAFYPERQLRSLAGVQKVVDLWKNMTRQPRWRAEYSRLVVHNLPAGKRTLFEHIAYVHNLDLCEDFRTDEKLQFAARQLAFPSHLTIRFDGDGKIQKKECSVFEVAFTKTFREMHSL